MKSLITTLGCMVLLLISCGGEKKKIPNNPVPTLENTRQADLKKSIRSEAGESKANDKAEAQEESTMTKEQLATAQKLIDKYKNVSLDNAKKIFKSSCAICHGFKGNMMINGAKDLTKSKISLKESVAQVYFGKGLMTPFKGVLKDEEIIAVSKYVETLRK